MIVNGPEIVGGIIGTLVVAGIVQAASGFIANKVNQTRQAEWHRENQEKFARLEKAMGIDDPDEAAFLRRSEADKLMEDKDEEHKRIWAKLDNHGTRIRSLEDRAQNWHSRERGQP